MPWGINMFWCPLPNVDFMFKINAENVYFLARLFQEYVELFQSAY